MDRNSDGRGIEDEYIEDLVKVACKRIEQRLIRKVKTTPIGPGDKVDIGGSFSINFTIGEGEYKTGGIDFKINFNSTD